MKDIKIFVCPECGDDVFGTIFQLKDGYMCDTCYKEAVIEYISDTLTGVDLANLLSSNYQTVEEYFGTELDHSDEEVREFKDRECE